MHVARSWKPARTMVFVCLGVAICCAACCSSARCDEPLRWKFKVGEKLDYNMTQEMKMTFPQPINMHQEVDILWDVQGVNEKGDAVIRLKFERIKMKAAPPDSAEKGAQAIEFDSTSDAQPTGLAALLAPLYKAMIEGEFEISMTARGEVTDVKIPEQVVTVMKNMPDASSMGNMATSEGFKKMLSKGVLVLPQEAPKVDDQWTTKIEVPIPIFGAQMTQTTTFRYVGTRKINGTIYAVIDPGIKMHFEEPQKASAQQSASEQFQPQVKDQQSSGEMLFDIKAGRLHSSQLKHNVTITAKTTTKTTDGKVERRTIEGKIDQQINVKVTPTAAKSK
jgi:hypothetical protein